MASADGLRNARQGLEWLVFEEESLVGDLYLVLMALEVARDDRSGLRQPWVASMAPATATGLLGASGWRVEPGRGMRVIELGPKFLNLGLGFLADPAVMPFLDHEGQALDQIPAVGLPTRLPC